MPVCISSNSSLLLSVYLFEDKQCALLTIYSIQIRGDQVTDDEPLSHVLIRTRATRCPGTEDETGMVGAKYRDLLLMVAIVHTQHDIAQNTTQ